MLLGLVPVLGGPTQPLHWAMAAGVFGAGALLGLRHRARGAEAALAPLSASAARPVGRTLLLICGIVAALICGIVVSRIQAGGSLSWLSVAMPLVGLAWFASLGLRALRSDDAPTETRRSADSVSSAPRAHVARRSGSRSTPPPRPQVSA
jgi:hypothetical protein